MSTIVVGAVGAVVVPVVGTVLVVVGAGVGLVLLVSNRRAVAAGIAGIDTPGRRDVVAWPTDRPFTPHRLRDLTRRQQAALLALGLLVLVTGVRVVGDLVHRDAVVVGDEALISLFAHDAPDDRPLVGKVTSAGLYGNLPTPKNPGPAESWTLAPFVLTLGTSVGAWTYAYVLNLGSALLAAWAGFRRGGPRLGLVVLVLSLVMFEIAAPGGITSVLNTRIVLLPLFASLVIAAFVALGDTALLAVLVALSTFVIQTHIGYAPVAAAGLLTATAVVLGRRLRGERDPGWWRHVGAAGVVALVAWAAPVFDQFFRTGNLGELLHARVPHGGVGHAVDALGTLVNPERIFLHRGELSSSTYQAPSVLVLVLLVAAGGWLWWTRPARVMAHAGALAVAAVVVAAAALTAGLTPPTDTGGEHFYWLRAVSFFLVTVLAVIVLARAPGHQPAERPVRPPALLGAVALVGLALAPLWVAKQFTPHDAQAMAAVHDLLPAVLDEADGPEPLALAHQGYWPAISVSDGLVTELVDRGVAVVQLDNPVAPEGFRTLVVIQGPPRLGAPIAASVPSGGDDDLDQVPEAVLQWVRAHGPLELAGPGRVDLATVLDGTSPELCLDRYVADPDLLLQLDPSVVADLYFQQQVSAPALPPPLLRDLERWGLRFPTELRLAEARDVGAGEGPDRLVLSTSDC